MEDWNWETIFTDNIGLYSTTVTYLASKEIEIGEKTQNKGYNAVQGHPRSSEVIEVGASPYATSYLVPFRRYRELIVQILDTLCVFEPPTGGLGTTYDVHLGLIGKHVVDFLLVIG